MLGGGGGGVSHPLQLTTGLVIKSITTSPTLAGERMLFILQVSILSEQSAKLDSRTKQHTQSGVSTSDGSRDISATKSWRKKRKKKNFF